MGCVSSKVENEEGVARCRARKRFMKQAVSSRHSFAASHAQYLQALKGAGAAFRQFAEGEVKDPGTPKTTVLPPAPSTPKLALIPPPPPMPPSPLSPILPPSPPPPSPPRIELPISRAVSLPTVIHSAISHPEPMILEEPCSPSPPLVTPVSLDDDWKYLAQAPPPPPPPHPGNPPPPPPPARSSWQDLFLDPFRPPPPSFHLMEQRKAKQQQAQAAVDENRKLKQLQEEGMPELEDEDIDGPRPKDSDDEKQEIEKPVEKVEVIPDPPAETAIVAKSEEKFFVKTEKELVIVVPPKGGRDLLDVLREVDDLFLKAAESGEAVSRMLETKKVHYHSSFSESLRGVGESARMFNPTFWRHPVKSSSPGHLRSASSLSTMSDDTASIGSIRSLSSLSSVAWNEECGMTGSHASTLDRLHAWEKKLYDEVKDADALRIELEKKYTSYRNQDAKGEDQLVIDKTRATIKMLQTRMVVAIQAVDSAATAVQKLRDDELYPQLLELLEGMSGMWKEMCDCHQAQKLAVELMRSLDKSVAVEATSSSHRQATVHLDSALSKWVESFGRVVFSQRDYMKNLNAWLRLSLMQTGLDDVERERNGSHSPRSPLHSVGAAPLYALCQQWQSSLDQLPDKVAQEAIAGFAAVVREMSHLQAEELRIKKKVETCLRELEKRESSLLSASMRELPSLPALPLRSPTSTSAESDENYEMIVSEGVAERSEVIERRMRLETARRKLEEERERERKAIADTRAYTLNSLQTGLPYMFQAMVTFSTVEVEIYEKLHSIGMSNKLARITNK